MLPIIVQEIRVLLEKVGGITGTFELGTPPKPSMGDFAFPCFAIAKAEGKNPIEVAKIIAEKINKVGSKGIIDDVRAFGPYVNFFVNGGAVARVVLGAIQTQEKKYGTHEIGKGKKYLIEFACPNPLKAFHLGHLKNLITGESVVRMFENAGYEVVRVNWQGDVGMHVAKALWGIFDWKEQFEEIRSKTLTERAEFLGRAYAHGSIYYEESDGAKEAITHYNDIVYDNSDQEVMAVYAEARDWSLEYFDAIYKRLDSYFDKLYFESQMFNRGIELVERGLKKNIFKRSEGAIIFPGSEFGLHDRVFITSKGFPTYEAKEMGLGEAHFNDFHPDKVIHVVGKEQMEYFRVAIKALEFVVPESVGKEHHLVGGFLQLKGSQKMSSRKGNIVTGDELIDEVTARVKQIMDAIPREKPVDQASVLEKVSVAALKYGMLKNNVSQDVSFDLEESLSVTGDSGPYLLYFVARIKSILRKAGVAPALVLPAHVTLEEKNLLLKLATWGDTTLDAVESLDPSKIAKYVYSLAHCFSDFYQACPVLSVDDVTKSFRLGLLSAVLLVAERGLYLLGIKTVEEM